LQAASNAYQVTLIDDCVNGERTEVLVIAERLFSVLLLPVVRRVNSEFCEENHKPFCKFLASALKLPYFYAKAS